MEEHKFIDFQATDDFNKARSREMVQRIIDFFTFRSRDLLSLQEVKTLVKARGDRRFVFC